MIPRFLYGIEVIPTNKSMIAKLVSVQNSFGKRLLGVKGSSGNAIVAMDLGLRPILSMIYKKKIVYYNRVKSPNFTGSKLIKKAMKYHEDKGSTRYTNEIRRIYREAGNSELVNKRQLHGGI
jgi:hypothetical protein